MKLLTKHLKHTLNTSPLKDISLLHIKVTREEMIWKNLMKYCAAKNSMEKGYRNTDEETGYLRCHPIFPPTQEESHQFEILC